MRLNMIFAGLAASLIVSGCSQKTVEEDTRNNVVSFINVNPVIDGRLDSELSLLPVREFNHKFTFDNPETDNVIVTYRLAYNATHLYLYIETDADEVSYHRRGYLWGDGYSLLLGMPNGTSGTNEYYEMTFSPTLNPEYDWDRQRIAVYNFSTPLQKFSSATSSHEKASDGRTGFETLIAWDDIRPYHPWLVDEIGFNLYFAKGFNSEVDGYYTHGHAVVEDEGIWDEEIEFRATEKLRFENPNNVTQNRLQLTPLRNNISIGQNVRIKIASVTQQKGEEKIRFRVLDSSGKIVLEEKATVKVKDSLAKETVELKTSELGSGMYSIEMTAGAEKATHSLSILPEIDEDAISRQLNAGMPDVPDGSAETLQFQLQEIGAKFKALKPYEDAHNIFEAWSVFSKEYKQFLSNQDPYADNLGPYRRGFKSKFDRTFQPYTIRLPENYNPNKTYPLLVFLHGSGQDEQSLLNRRRSNGQFIELAPYGRDKFRAYASPESQIDIVEAIDAAAASFPIDRSKVIIGGFSMGGYGALRAFYEHPDLYKGVAVFAGHPNLASEWLDEEHPNFLDEKYLSDFSGTPVFIYHGMKDAALDVKLMQEAAEKLEKVGAQMTTSWPEDKGHQFQDDRTNALYHEWLKRIIDY